MNIVSYLSKWRNNIAIERYAVGQQNEMICVTWSIILLSYLSRTAVICLCDLEISVQPSFACRKLPTLSNLIKIATRSSKLYYFLCQIEFINNNP